MSAVRSNDASHGLDHVLDQLKASHSGPKLKELQTFATLLLQRMPQEELAEHPGHTWAGLASSLLRFFRERPSGAAKVRVYNPSLDEHGWDSTHTVVEIVNDDMPFLVDTVSMAIGTDGTLIHLIAHPVLKVQRDPGGHILSFGADDEGHAESVMHFQVDRQTEPERLESLRERIESALADVRACVRDFDGMHHRMLAIAESLADAKPPHDGETVIEAADFLRWAADNHFTFLGYRAYETSMADGQTVLRAVQGSGLGILKGDESQLPTRPLRANCRTS